MQLLFALCLTYIVWGVSPSFAQEETESPKFAELEVRIKAPDIKLPAPMQVKMDVEVCGTTKTSEILQLGPNRELIDAVVWVEGPQTLAWPRPTDEDFEGPSFESKNCELSPRVVISRPREMIRFFNRDPILHSFRAEGKKNYPVFRAHPPKLASTSIRLEHPEIVPIASDLHPWMKAYVVVAPHQNYAISNSAGVALISRLRRGKYTLHLWHPSLGDLKVSEEIEIQGRKLSLSIDWKIPTP